MNADKTSAVAGGGAHYAVAVRDLYKTYATKKSANSASAVATNAKPVLDGLSMLVPKGVIYGLLGASGCGKTTLLSCIVGCRSFNSGEIWVLGGKPGSRYSGIPGPRVGYMPQEIGLIGEFTVQDAVYYFGNLAKMTQFDIMRNYCKLAELLELPPADRFVKNCSGGQQRRISFAAAMIHEPELLILDEPTVGVDPILRDKIWNYLVEITQNKKTSVIITTHYIEEAKQANIIGLMRNGVLLTEASPNDLLHQYQTDTLETVFLELSKRQQTELAYGKSSRRPPPQPKPAPEIAQPSETYAYDRDEIDANLRQLDFNRNLQVDKPTAKFRIDRRNFRTLVWKNWLQFARNYGGIFFTVVFPLVQILAFFGAVGTDIRNIRIGVVNDEQVECRRLSDPADFRHSVFTMNDTCYVNGLSCLFLQQIDPKLIEQVEYSDLETAIADTRNGRLTGAISFARNFSVALEKRILVGKDTEPSELNSSTVHVWLDMSNKQIGEIVKMKLFDNFVSFSEQLQTYCKRIPKLISPPVDFRGYFYGNKDDSFQMFMLPGIIVTMVFFMGTMMTSSIIISDRLAGVWNRSLVLGVNTVEVLLSHFVVQLVLVVFQVLEMIVLSFWVFEMRNNGTMFSVIVVLVLVGVTGMLYGFLVSIVCDSHSTANILATGGFYPMIMISGVMWPLEGMPKLLQWIAKCMPFTLPIVSLRSVLQKAWTLAETEVWSGLAVSTFWIVLLLAFSLRSLRTKA